MINKYLKYKNKYINTKYNLIAGGETKNIRTSTIPYIECEYNVIKIQTPPELLPGAITLDKLLIFVNEVIKYWKTILSQIKMPRKLLSEKISEVGKQIQDFYTECNKEDLYKYNELILKQFNNIILFKPPLLLPLKFNCGHGYTAEYILTNLEPYTYGEMDLNKILNDPEKRKIISELLMEYIKKVLKMRQNVLEIDKIIDEVFKLLLPYKNNFVEYLKNPKLNKEESTVKDTADVEKEEIIMRQKVNELTKLTEKYGLNITNCFMPTYISYEHSLQTRVTKLLLIKAYIYWGIYRQIFTIWREIFNATSPNIFLDGSTYLLNDGHINMPVCPSCRQPITSIAPMYQMYVITPTEDSPDVPLYRVLNLKNIINSITDKSANISYEVSSKRSLLIKLASMFYFGIELYSNPLFTAEEIVDTSGNKYGARYTYKKPSSGGNLSCINLENVDVHSIVYEIFNRKARIIYESKIGDRRLRSTINIIEFYNINLLKLPISDHQSDHQTDKLETYGICEEKLYSICMNVVIYLIFNYDNIDEIPQKFSCNISSKTISDLTLKVPFTTKFTSLSAELSSYSSKQQLIISLYVGDKLSEKVLVKMNDEATATDIRRYEVLSNVIARNKYVEDLIKIPS